jgi:hypothetical protein
MFGRLQSACSQRLRCSSASRRAAAALQQERDRRWKAWLLEREKRADLCQQQAFTVIMVYAAIMWFMCDTPVGAMPPVTPDSATRLEQQQRQHREQSRQAQGKKTSAGSCKAGSCCTL